MAWKLLVAAVAVALLCLAVTARQNRAHDITPPPAELLCSDRGDCATERKPRELWYYAP